MTLFPIPKSWRSWPQLMVVLVGLLYTSACESNTTPTSENADSPIISEAPTPTNYYQLRGTLAGEAVTFDLLREFNEVYPETGYFRGFYRYDRFGGPIALYGSIDSTGNLVLEEQAAGNQDNHLLKGKWTDKGYVGHWSSGSSRDEHPFELSLQEDGFVPFTYQSLADSIVAFPAWEASPQATFSARWLAPMDVNMEARKMEFIKRAIASGLSHSKLSQEGSTDIASALAAAKASYFDDYRREMVSLYQDGSIDSTDVDGYFPYSYIYEKSLAVYFNSAELLTLGFTDYTYMGGAHGMYGTTVQSYDLAAQRALQLVDVLKPGYELVLSEALAKALRTKFQLEDDTPLSEVLFEDTLEPNTNFGLTDKGIFFVYQPYEVAAYVFGEIELFIPFERIADYVKE